MGGRRSQREGRRVVRAPMEQLALRHPAVLLAIDAAVAASAAWLSVVPLGGVVDRYPYYAPLGAVVAVSSSIAGALRGSVTGVAGILVGAGIAVAVRLLPAPMFVQMAAVVALGTFIGARRWPAGSAWIVWSAIFVLAVGGSDPWTYALAYSGLVAWGAAVGLAVLIVLPPLPLVGSASAARRLGEVLAAQLADLADGLRMEGPPTSEQWARRRHEIDPLAHAVSVATREFARAGRGNWRWRRWGGAATTQEELATALHSLVLLTEHLTSLLTSEEAVGRETLALGAGLRGPVARLLDPLGDLVGQVGRYGRADRADLHEVVQALEELVRRVRECRRGSEDDFFTVGAVVTVVRHALGTLGPLCDEAG